MKKILMRTIPTFSILYLNAFRQMEQMTLVIDIQGISPATHKQMISDGVLCEKRKAETTLEKLFSSNRLRRTGLRIVSALTTFPYLKSAKLYTQQGRNVSWYH